jgi:hypothetical protein
VETEHVVETATRVTDAPSAMAHSPAPVPAPALDLDAIGRDLADVEVALTRLDAGTYWVDEVTGAELPAALLDEQPTARRTTVA